MWHYEDEVSSTPNMGLQSSALEVNEQWNCTWANIDIALISFSGKQLDLLKDSRFPKSVICYLILLLEGQWLCLHLHMWMSKIILGLQTSERKLAAMYGWVQLKCLHILLHLKQHIIYFSFVFRCRLCSDTHSSLRGLLLQCYHSLVSVLSIFIIHIWTPLDKLPQQLEQSKLYRSQTLQCISAWQRYQILQVQAHSCSWILWVSVDLTLLFIPNTLSKCVSSGQ